MTDVSGSDDLGEQPTHTRALGVQCGIVAPEVVEQSSFRAPVDAVGRGVKELGDVPQLVVQTARVDHLAAFGDLEDEAAGKLAPLDLDALARSVSLNRVPGRISHDDTSGYSLAPG